MTQLTLLLDIGIFVLIDDEYQRDAGECEGDHTKIPIKSTIYMFCSRVGSAAVPHINCKLSA